MYPPDGMTCRSLRNHGPRDMVVDPSCDVSFGVRPDTPPRKVRLFPNIGLPLSPGVVVVGWMVGLP